MAPNEATTSETKRADTKRFTESVSAEELIEGDRIAPALIPRSPHIEVGEPVAGHIPARYGEDDDRTFDVRLVVKRERQPYGNVQNALVWDPDADLFVRLSGHTASGARNQHERDWIVRGIGDTVVVDDVQDVEIPDLPDDATERGWVEEWVEIVFDALAHGEQIDDLESFDGKHFTLRDWDSRKATVQYHLETED